LVVVIADQDPDTGLAVLMRQNAGLDSGRIWMWASVIDVVDTKVQVANGALSAIAQHEVLARHAAVEFAFGATLNDPTKEVGVEAGGLGRIVARKVDEDQGIRVIGDELSGRGGIVGWVVRRVGHDPTITHRA